VSFRRGPQPLFETFEVPRSRTSISDNCAIPRRIPQLTSRIRTVSERSHLAIFSSPGKLGALWPQKRTQAVACFRASFSDDGDYAHGRPIFLVPRITPSIGIAPYRCRKTGMEAAMNNTNARPKPYRSRPIGIFALGVIAMYGGAALLVYLLFRFL